MANSKEDQLLQEIVDYVVPTLPSYDLGVYLVLLKKSHLDSGTAQVRIGKRTLLAALGRTDGKFGHLTERLKALMDAGFIEIHDTDRLGTLYTVLLPSNVTSVQALMHAAEPEHFDIRDHYNDPELRQEIFVRDKWKCQYCGELLSPTTSTLDHVIPVSAGGTNAASNLVAACLVCNSIKSGRTYDKAAPQLLARIVEKRSDQ